MTGRAWEANRWRYTPKETPLIWRQWRACWGEEGGVGGGGGNTLKLSGLGKTDRQTDQCSNIYLTHQHNLTIIMNSWQCNNGPANFR